MRRTVSILTATAATLFLASGAQGALFGARVGAADAPKVAKFYQSVFGLQETNRLELPNLFEIMLNFGDSVSAAKENKNPSIIVIRRESDDIKDTVPHLIFTVTDLTATIAAVTAAGGKMDGAPRAFNEARLG
jgi:predicted enzyme related to lactoylglutathione lyase